MLQLLRAPFLWGPLGLLAIKRIYYIIYKIFLNLRNQYFAKFSVSSKQRFSIEDCLCPEILVWLFLYSYITKGIRLRSVVLPFKLIC